MPKEFSGGPITSISGTKLRGKKNKKQKTLSRCKCSICGQESNASPNTPHAGCPKLVPVVTPKPLPDMFKNLMKENKVPGNWIPIVSSEAA